MRPASESVSRAATDSSEDLNASQPRLLVVDDDATIREVLTDLLVEMGCAPETAVDGVEAVEKAIKGQFDLILLDLMLPKMSGQDTFETLKSIDDSIPIIIITGYGSIESAVEFFKNGAVDYLTKPVNFEEFRFRINRALEEKRLKEAAITDLKTQLFNHSYFVKRLKEEFGRAERYGHDISLIMLDLDNFKHYNDCFGHLAGDDVLREIGKLLKKLVRDCDIPCRFGGEEFSIILPETDSPGAMKVAERIRTHIERGTFNEDSIAGRQKVTVSIGVATFSPSKRGSNGCDMTLLIDKADKALYEAKRTGKNRICTVEISAASVADIKEMGQASTADA